MEINKYGIPDKGGSDVGYIKEELKKTSRGALQHTRESRPKE